LYVQTGLWITKLFPPPQLTAEGLAGLEYVQLTDLLRNKVELLVVAVNSKERDRDYVDSLIAEVDKIQVAVASRNI